MAIDTLAQLRTTVQNDLSIGDESPLFATTTVDLAINRAYRKIAAYKPWPELQDAKKTSTQANIEYYDYPQNWRSNSIWKVMVDSVRYGEDPDGSPISFDDYLSWKEDNPTSTEKKWANQWRRYFIWPVPTTAGNCNISVWGVKVVDYLDEDGDVTVFTYSMPEGNEAIILEATAILKAKGEREDQGTFRSKEAKEILDNSWKIIAKEMAKYEKIEPFFNVPDYYSGDTSSSKIGDFD